MSNVLAIEWDTFSCLLAALCATTEAVHNHGADMEMTGDTTFAERQRLFYNRLTHYMLAISVDDYIEEEHVPQLISHVREIGAQLLTFLEQLFNESKEGEEQVFLTHKVHEVQEALKHVEKREHKAPRGVGCKKVVALDLAFREAFGE